MNDNNINDNIIVLILIFIIIIASYNYYNGKHFKQCKLCSENEVNIIDVLQLPDNLIKQLELDIKKNGILLKPTSNFNNAQGKKINYNQLHYDIKKFYSNIYFKNTVSSILNIKVELADNTEQYRMFARLYDSENDFLDWHYDNNFTIGQRFTLVIPVLVDDNNTSEFMIRDRKTLQEKIIKIPIGKGVVYNGSITYHRITKQTKGNRRMVIIIPFYTNYKKSIFGNIREIFRNITDSELKL